MKEIQFFFDGGLGNQLFQFIASKYIAYKFKDINIRYSQAESILKGYRDFEINKLIKEPIEIRNQNNNIIEKINSKIVFNLPFLSLENKKNLNYKINLINSLYCEKNRKNKFTDGLSLLDKDLLILKKKFYKLKVKGFWQNPSSYYENIHYYENFLIDTKKFIPRNIPPNKYITIHIRRGDYLWEENYKSYMYNFSPIGFILSALHLIPEDINNMPIYLLSDDKRWTKNLIVFLREKFRYQFFLLDTKNHFQDWSILKHSALNICSNSTFSYTAALLNKDNIDRKLRCIVPQWIKKDISAFEKGWLVPPGFIDI